MCNLDEKYDNPEKMGGFQIFFGKKYKGQRFEDAAQDEGYSRFIMGCEPKSSCLYLFQKYIEAVRPEWSPYKQVHEYGMSEGRD